jgi:hypothetical protein
MWDVGRGHRTSTGNLWGWLANAMATGRAFLPVCRLQCVDCGLG